MTSQRTYEGTELELFERAHNWKAYWAAKIGPYVKGNALEVGAGLGANQVSLGACQGVHWTLLEPDPGLCEGIRGKIADSRLPVDTRVICGMLKDLPANERFDSILYIDVLEHIADDRGELATAAERLAPGGNLVVLSPAYQAVYSPFDAAIGHHRRYDRKSLLAAAPPSLEPRATLYLDSLGLMLSIVNRYLARQSMPTPTTIHLWDSKIVPLSRIADRVVGNRFGRSIIGIWTKPSAV